MRPLIQTLLLLQAIFVHSKVLNIEQENFNRVKNDLGFHGETDVLNGEEEPEFTFFPTSVPSTLQIQVPAIVVELVSRDLLVERFVGSSGSPAPPIATVNAVWGDSIGSIYASSERYIYKILSGGDIVSVFAGNGGSSIVDGVPAIESGIDSVTGLAGDSNGNIFLVDQGANIIRKIDALTAIVNTIAGSTYHYGLATNYAPALSTYLSSPSKLWIATDNSIYFTNSGVNQVLKLVYDYNMGSYLIEIVYEQEIEQEGGEAPLALQSNLQHLVGITGDNQGNIFLSDKDGGFIYMLSTEGSLNAIIGGGTEGTSLNPINAFSVKLIDPNSLFFHPNGNLYCSERNQLREFNFTTNDVVVISGRNTSGFNGEVVDSQTVLFNDISDFWVDKDGTFFIADTNNGRIRHLQAGNGFVSTFFAFLNGDGGYVQDAHVGNPLNLWGDSFGNLYYVERNFCAVKKVNVMMNTVTTFGGTSSCTSGSFDGFPFKFTSLSPFLTAIWGAENGDYYFVDEGMMKVSKADKGGAITTLDEVTVSTSLASIFGSLEKGLILIASPDEHVVKQFSIATSDLLNFAGTRLSEGTTGDGGLAILAKLNRPHGIWIDTTLSVFIADTNNHKIRKVSPDGIITTVIGDEEGFIDNVYASEARLSYPSAITGDSIGNIFIADSGNYCIRMLFCMMQNCLITTLVGTGFPPGDINIEAATQTPIYAPLSVWIDTLHQIYFIDSQNSIQKVSILPEEPTIAPTAATSDLPYVPIIGQVYQYVPPDYSISTVWVDSLGGIYTDASSFMIRHISNDHEWVETIGGNPFPDTYEFEENRFANETYIAYLTKMWGDSVGNLYYVDRGKSFLVQIDAISRRVSSIGPVNKPNYVWGNTAGHLFVSESTDRWSTSCVRRISSSNMNNSNGTFLICDLMSPTGVWGDTEGLVYVISEGDGRMWRFNETIQQQVIGWSRSINPTDDDHSVGESIGFGGSNGLWVDSHGTIFITLSQSVVKYDPNTDEVRTVAGGSYNYPANFGDEGPATGASFSNAEDVWGDSIGNIFIADKYHCRIRKVDINNIIHTVANYQFGDGGPATSVNIYTVSGLWGDTVGNVLFLDQSNCVIRIVDVEGTINTIGGVWSCIPVASPLPQNGILFNASYLSNYASGFWIDDGNNYYYIDQRAIKRVSALNQTVSTVAVNVVGLWEIAGGLIGDNRGNFFISVPDLNIIQKVDVTGVLTRFAGVFESSGYNGDGIPALEASLYHPVGLWLSSLNELFFADQYNHRIRKIDELGNVSTIAGTGFSSFNGDEGLATGIDLSSPTQVFGDDIGNLFIADYNNFKVRMLTRKGNTPNYYLRTVIGATNGYYPNYWDSPFGYPTNIWISNANHTLYVAFQRNGYTSIVMNEYLSQLSDDITPEPTTSPLSIVSRRKLKVNRLNLFNKLDLQDFDPLEVQSSITPTSYPSTFPTLHRLVSFSMNVFAGASYYVSSSYTVSTLWGNTNGVLYSDASLKLIREVSPSGHSKKFAGVEGGSLPLEGFLDGSNARETYIGQISKIWGDTIGNLFYSDLYLNLIVEISAGTKLVRGVASVNAPIMMWGNTLGQLFVTEGGETNCVRKIDLIQTHSSMMFLCGQNYPSGIGGDTVGSIYFIANGPGRLIRSQAPNEMDILIGPPLGEEDEELNQLARFGKLWDADGIWVDSLGSIYYSSRYYQQIIHYDPLTGFILPFAGTSSSEFSGDGGPATTSSLNNPRDVWGDTNGNIFIADTQNYRIRKVDPNGIIYTVIDYIGGSGGSATNVYIRQPSGVWGDKQGNLFYVDRGYCVIRKVDRSGTIINIAGTWNCGYGDDGRPANATQISDWSFGFWGDEAGNYYYLDNRNLRKIESGFNNVVTTLYYSVTNDKDAINLQDQQAQYELFLTGDNDGNLFVVIPYQHVIKQYDISGNGFKGLFAGMFQQGGYNGDGPFPTEATLNYPASMWIDGDHNVFIADQWNHRIRMVDGASGYIRTIAGTGNSGYNGDKMEATNAWLNNPCSITGDGEGTLFVVDRDNQRVRILTPSIGADNVLSYTIDTALGNDGNSNWYLDKPLSVWMRDVNHLLLLQRRYGYYMITETHPDIAFPSDSPVTTPYSNNEARRLSDSYPTNRPTQFADAPVYSIPVSQPYYAPYLTNYYPSPHESSTTSYPAPVSRPSNRPTQVPTFYNLGEVTLLTQFFVSSWEFSGQSYEIATIWGNSIGEIFSDADGRFIRKITNFGQSVNLVAGCEVCPFADYHDGNFAISTKLYGITKIWGDTLGNLFIVDQVANMIIQVLSAERTVWKVGNIDSPSMMWGNTLGQLFISEKSNHYENGRRSNCILQFSLNSSSQYDSSDYFCGFQYPTGVWGDSSGAIYTISQWDGRLMKLNDQQSIEVVVGLPSGKDDDDLKPSLTANIQSCHGMWGDSNGAMFMASWTHQIRQYDSNLREVTNVAGNGNSWGDLGDGKLATEASLSSPTDVWGDTNGNLFIADSYHYRVRKVDTAGIIQTVVDYQGGDFGPASLAYLGSPVSLRGDSNGNIYVVDQSYCIIRKVNTVGIITTIGGAWSCGSQGITGKALNGNQFNSSFAGLTLDTAGNFYFLELDAIKIARASDNYNVSTICSGITKGGFEEGNGQWVNPSVLSLLRDDGGNFFVLVPDQHVIKLYRSDCEVQIVAGVYGKYGYNGDELSATSSSLYYPRGFWRDSNGVMFIADLQNQRIRKLSADGLIHTVAGNGNYGYNGDHRDATSATLANPSAVVGDAYGNLFIADRDNNRVRWLKPYENEDGYFITSILGNPSVYNSGNNPPLGARRLQEVSQLPLGMPFDLWADKNRSVLYILRNLWGYNTVVSVQLADGSPTVVPSIHPTLALSLNPTTVPSSVPTSSPSVYPTVALSAVDPTAFPSSDFGSIPSDEPTSLTRSPSLIPNIETTHQPTLEPTEKLTEYFSVNPTCLPTSMIPTTDPSVNPTHLPSLTPSNNPTFIPTLAPSLLKTQSPTAVPSCAPSGAPVVPLTPALIVNTVITVSNSSITTQILLSNDGIVSGGLFVVDAIAPSISQIVSQNINCVSQNKKCTVTFRSLIAATEYNVYFYTKSVDGVAMSADQVLQTKQAATTACCKPILISLSTSRLVEGQSYANLISVSVTSLPKTSLSLTLWLGQDLSPRTIQNALVPSQIAFAATSSSSYRVGLSSQVMGRYYLGVSLTGVEASSYQVVFEGLSSVSSENAMYVASFPVLPSNASLPAPMLSRASFSNDGASVIVELDSTSNLAGMTVGTTFACNQLFDFLCVASAKCQWVGGKTIYASVPTSSSCALNVGNYIKFSSSAIIKAACTSAASCVNYDRWPSSNTTKTVVLSTASSPVTPSVVISIPKSIGACSPLSIDLTSSSGNGGRAWKSISITVASSSSNSTLLNQLRSFLSTIKTVNPPTVVAARYFTAGDQYSFTARLCNFLDQCGQTAQTLTIVSNTIPLISIAGASIVTLTRSQPLSLITNTQLSSCSGTASVGLTGLSYSWSVAVINDGNSFTKLSGLVSTSKDPSRFLLPAFSLTAGLSYQITVNVTYIPSGTFSIASAQLVVPQGKVKAVIAGSSQQNVRVKESLILDASRSYDEDVANSFGTAAGLQYQWSCVQTEPVLNNSCAAIFDMAKWTASITTGSMLISTLSSASNTKAQVTVLIVDKTNTRSSSVTIVVSVLPALLPTISLTASSSQINAGQTLQITGTVNYPASIEGNATWQILSGESGRNLSSLASTGLTQQFLRSSSAQSYSMYLVIPPNRLTIGTTYTFGLLAFSSYRGMSTLGSISVIVNAPPVLGSFSISPTSGEQLLQSFSFLCNDWVDQNLPLSYQFSYLSLVGTKVVVRSMSIVSYASALLPAGSKSSNNTLWTVADVYDSLFANTTTSFSVQVYTSKTTSGSNNSAVNSFISKSLNPSKWTSVDDILQGTAIASYLLNQANCSLPSNYCTSRNRKPCATTSLTCGLCLSSAFVGTAGDSNDHCYSLEELKARAQVNNTLPLSTKSKECAGNCSSHGVCAYTSVKSGTVIGQCYEGDLTCSASCICSPGYTLSNNCELSDAEVEQKRNLREQVIAGIQQYVSLQDANEQSVSSWIDSMNDATQNPNELSEHSVSTVLDVANYAIKVATENGFDSSSLSSIVTSLDALASAVALKERRRRLTSGSSSSSAGIGGVELMQTLSNYSQLIGQQMLPGQEATSAVQSNFRFVVQSVGSTSSISSGRRMLSSSAACASNISITLPRSSLEQFVGTEESAIRLPTCPDDQSSALSISVVSLSSTLYDAALFKSDPVSLHLSSTPCTDPENCNAEIILQSDNLGRGVTLQASNVTYKCEAGDQAKHEVICPGGKKYEITCDGKGSTVVATCPAERAVPTCNGLFGSATSDIGCKVVASSDTTTTCSCPIVVSSYLSPERRALSSNSTIISSSCSVTYLGMLRQVTDTFQATVLSAADLNASTIERSWMSLVTVGSLVVAFVVALIISHYTDAKTKNKIAFDEKVSNNLSLMKAHKRTTGYKYEKGGAPTSQYLEQRRDQSVAMLADEALPEILRSQSLWNRIWNEMKRYHRWVGVIYYYSPKFPRALRVVSLATNITIMLFIQSLTYELTNGDDGTCETFKNQDDCLTPTSSYGTGQSKCYWTPSVGSSSTVGDCQFVQPDNSIEIVIFVAIFSALVSTPIALLADWILHQILSAPDMTRHNDKTKDESFAPVAPLSERATSAKLTKSLSLTSISWRESKSRKSMTGMFNAVVESEYNRLQTDLIQYRASLSKREERREMDELWGLDEAGGVSKWEGGPTALQSSSWTTNMITRWKSAVQSPSDQQKTIAVTIKNDLQQLHSSLEKETQSFSMISAERWKMKRLLFLFQKDLIPGILGEIMDSKDARDNMMINPVSRTAKLLAWIFLGLLNSGMLFYVFLFASSQDQHRQAAWGKSFAAWLVTEILLVSSGMVVFMHIFLPSLLMKDVGKIKKRLIESIAQYYENMEKKEASGGNSENRKKKRKGVEKEQPTFNAAKYLFLSYRLAERFPDLKASKIILQFTTPWPKQSYQHVTDVKKKYADTSTALSRSISIVAVFLLTNLLSVPLAIQDMIIHMCMTASIGYTMLLHIQLYQVFPVLVLVPTLFIGGLIHFYFTSAKKQDEINKAKLKKVSKVKTDNKDETKHGDDFSQSSDDEDNDEDEETHASLPSFLTPPKETIKEHMTRRQSLAYGLQLSKEINNTVKQSRQKRIQLFDMNDDNAEEEEEGSSNTSSKSFKSLSYNEGAVLVRETDFDREFYEMDLSYEPQFVGEERDSQKQWYVKKDSSPPRYHSYSDDYDSDENLHQPVHHSDQEMKANHGDEILVDLMDERERDHSDNEEEEEEEDDDNAHQQEDERKMSYDDDLRLSEVSSQSYQVPSQEQLQSHYDNRHVMKNLLLQSDVTIMPTELIQQYQQKQKEEQVVPQWALNRVDEMNDSEDDDDEFLFDDEYDGNNDLDDDDDNEEDDYDVDLAEIREKIQSLKNDRNPLLSQRNTTNHHNQETADSSSSLSSMSNSNSMQNKSMSKE